MLCARNDIYQVSRFKIFLKRNYYAFENSTVAWNHNEFNKIVSQTNEQSYSYYQQSLIDVNLNNYFIIEVPYHDYSHKD